MQARAAEARGDPREAQRRAQEGLAQRPPVGLVVAGAGGSLVAHRPQHALAANELGGQDPPVARLPAIDVKRLDEHAERVAGPDLGIEVDVPLEDVGQVERELVALARALIAPNRLDSIEPVTTLVRVSYCFCSSSATSWSSAARDAQRAQLVDAVGESVEQAVRTDRDAERASHGDTREVVQGAGRGDQPSHGLRLHDPRQQRADRVVVADRPADQLRGDRHRCAGRRCHRIQPLGRLDRCEYQQEHGEGRQLPHSQYLGPAGVYGGAPCPSRVLRTLRAKLLPRGGGC